MLVAKDADREGQPGDVVGRQGLFQAIDHAEERGRRRARSPIRPRSAARSRRGHLPRRAAHRRRLRGRRATRSRPSSAPTQRAISVPVDARTGWSATSGRATTSTSSAASTSEALRTGRRPQRGRPAVLKLIVEDVARARRAGGEGPVSDGGTETQHVVLRMSETGGGRARVRLRQRQGLDRAAAADGRRATAPDLVTLETLLLGMPDPIGGGASRIGGLMP